MDSKFQKFAVSRFSRALHATHVSQTVLMFTDHFGIKSLHSFSKPVENTPTSARLLLFSSFICSILLFTVSCGKPKFETNESLLRKAIKLAIDKGDWKNAQIMAFKAVNQNPKDANARILFALTLEQADELDRAIEEIKQAVIIDTENFMAQYTKGRLLFKSQSYEDCPDPLENAKRLMQNSPQTLSLLARSYALLGVNDKAIKNYVALAKLNNYAQRPEIYNELGVLFYEKEDYLRSARLFKKALSLDMDAPTVNLNMAVLCDNLCFISKDAAIRIGYARISEKHYIRYLRLTNGNPALGKSQKAVSARIKKIRSINDHKRN